MINPLVAATERQYDQTIARYQTGENRTLSVSDEGLWLRQGSAFGQTVIHAARANGDGTALFGASFFVFDPDGTAQSRIDAAEARLTDGAWQLGEVKLWPLGQANPEAAATTHADFTLPSTLTRDQIRDSFGRPSTIPIYDLPGFIAQLRAAGFGALQHRAWFMSELANPVLLAAMVLIGASFTMRHTRFGKTGMMVLVALLLGFGLYFLRNFAQVLGEAGQLPVAVAVWTPPLPRSCCRWVSCCTRRTADAVAAALRGAIGDLLAAQAAQPAAVPATLIADDIRFSRATTTVTANGNVEIFHDGARLRATRVRYDGTLDRVVVEGPITLTEESGRSIVFAEFAELSADLQQGVLQSARLVLDRQLQIAATQINREAGRYTQMYQTVASSCEVCAENPIPLWQIRARRIVHDQQERQLYFEDAQFRALGVPIAYFPRLRLPDPTLERATGFLVPQAIVDERLGSGVRLPYFIEIGPHADLTLTPFVTTGDSQTLEARFRRAFRNGFIEINGAISRDDLTPDASRSYLFAEGQFDLPRDFVLDLQYQTVSDPDYLLTYGYSDADILRSGADLSRARRDEYIELSFDRYRSLRTTDDNVTLPTTAHDAEVTRRFTPAGIGGIATVGLTSHAHHRRSDADIVGRDLARLSLNANWRRDWVLAGGLLAAVEAEWQGDLYNIRQDNRFDEVTTRTTPTIAAELRWPLARGGNDGVTHLVEPVLQYVWAPDTQPALPNDDGAIVAFDEGNLFSLNRFPGADGRELGQRLTYGLSYTRQDPDGWSLGLTVGQVLRDRDFGQFTRGSGLDGRHSDVLVSASLNFGSDLTLMNRATFSDAFSVSSNELSLAWHDDRFDVASSVTWLQADLAEGRPQDVAEWAFDARYDFDNAWGTEIDWRYDFESSEPTRAGLSLLYTTECVDVQFSLSRRFTSSATLPEATSVGLTVSLNGFGASRDGRSHDRSCRM